uniref:Uncharacterized protein n=1 Tax=Panagrolaimus davidi TaxID=227884 RepID=A0A914R7N0_9BILA
MSMFLAPSPQSPTTSSGPHNFKRDHYRHSTSGYSTPGAASVYSSYSTSPNVGCLTSVRMSAMAKLSRFLRRLVHFRQMDFEFAGWQMWSLLTHPQLVYRKFVYRKRKGKRYYPFFENYVIKFFTGTKDQWARDDPAFLVLLAVALSLSLVDYPYFISRLIGNAVWFIACVYYVYITFLGYTALPILRNTQIFLYPITFIFIFFVATVSAGWNISQTAMDFYHFRAMNANR